MIVSLSEAKAHLNIINDNSDDALISSKIAAAEAFINRQLGFDMEGEFGEGAVPADLKEAILQLMAHFYENREASLVGVGASLLPMGVGDIIASHRNWSF